METKKTTKKIGNFVKIVTIILAIICVSMISFIGIYVQKQNRMENIMKDYDLAMDLNGGRVISIKPKDETETIIKDAEGNVIDEELTDEEITEKGYTKEEVKKNEGKLTEENFGEAKKIIIKRLDRMGVENYDIKLNKQTGEFTIQIEENKSTDSVVSNLPTVGKFEIIDSETQEVLMNNDDIKDAKVLYGAETEGTSVYLQIDFNKEGKEKLEEITNTYRTVENSTTDENTTEAENTTTEENTTEENTENTTGENAENTTTEGETTEETDEAEKKQKEITMKIDDETIMSTSFETPIHTGMIQLNVGSASTDADLLTSYAERAVTIAAVLENGVLPIEYETSGNEFIFSEITTQELQYVVYAIAGVVAVGVLYFIIRYRLRGILASFAYIGYIATYLLLIRYANVTLSLEGIFGIILVFAISYVFIERMILHQTDKQQDVTFFLKIIPLCVSAIVFCFIEWVPITSLGMTLFWGIVLMAVYHYVVTSPLISMLGKKE